MLPDQPFPAYAQYHEDLVLAALLEGVESGFYVDVGANHAELHSVTKYFYDRGWSGINLEPTPSLFNALVNERPRDLNLNLAVADHPGSMTFREYPQHDGLSTLATRRDNDPLPHRDYDVRVDTLTAILEANGVGHVDFLKVDVEGFEGPVLEGNDWARFRPTVVCVEANAADAPAWRGLLPANGYVEFISDGLNRYYVEQDSIAITSGFADRVTVYAHFAVTPHSFRQWRHDAELAAQLTTACQRQERAIQELTKALGDAAKLLEDVQRQLRS